MKKNPHNISPLAKLPPDQAATVIRWLNQENLTYTAAAARIETQFGVKTSRSSLCSWYQAQSKLRLAAPMAPPAAHGQPGPAILEIIVDVSAPNIVRLKIIPGAGVHVEGVKS